MHQWMECMAASFPDKVTLISIGKSSEGRLLQVMRIGSGSKNKPAVFIDGGIHAREWVSPAAVTYVVHRMLEGGSEFAEELQTYNIYVLPLANPDGYEYSRNHDRMWRKTRSRTGKKNLLGQECHGVDPNRNFGFEWGGYGASENACKETFRGSGPFSEPETRAMRDFILGERADFKLYLTFHSYGQYILYPWGYDTLDTFDFRDLHRVGNVAARALKQTNGVNYQLGSAAKMLYPASGGSDDWAKGGAHIKYSYTIELPDTGRHGFILPARFIRRVGFQVKNKLLLNLEIWKDINVESASANLWLTFTFVSVRSHTCLIWSFASNCSPGIDRSEINDGRCEGDAAEVDRGAGLQHYSKTANIIVIYLHIFIYLFIYLLFR